MNEREPSEPEDRELAEVVERAGPRPAVSPDDLAAVTTAFRAEWQRQMAARKRAVNTRRWLLAASLVVGLGAAWWWTRGGALVPPPPRIATVETLRGLVTTPDGDLAIGHDLLAGSSVETGRGSGDHLALRTTTGLALRLDAGTRLRLDGADRVTLERGAVYVDSGPAGHGIAVATPLGVARDLGTRFEVRLLGDGSPALRVRVRDGQVEVAAPGVKAAAGAGVELTVGGDGSVHRTAVPAHGPDWQWVIAAAPPFQLEGRSLADFLAWVTTETGWSVVYDDPSLAASAATISLHGSLAGLPADQAPGVVLPGAALDYRLEESILRVSRQR